VTDHDAAPGDTDEATSAGGTDPADDGAERAPDPLPVPGSARARATIRSRVADPETVAAALSPDDTDEMSTRVEDGRVIARIERPTAGGLRTTADDYVTNLQVAVQLTTDTDQP
jgi:hypothetical protein